MNARAGSIFRRPEFIAVAIIGCLSLVMIKALFDLSVLLVALGVAVSLLAGLLVGFLQQQSERERRLDEMLGRLAVPVALAPEPVLFQQYSSIAESFDRLKQRDHPVLRDFAHYTIAQFVQRIERISHGTLEFEGTESWRAAYKELLNAPHVKSYRSVALIKQSEYWHDDAGEGSLQENLRLIHKGKTIERIAILSDYVWPSGRPLLETEIGKWLKRQADGSIRVYVVRDSALAADPDLRVDFGIYGEDAVGVQELDENARTKKFTFFFDDTEKRLAEQRWKRLLAYSKPLEEFIDQRAAHI